MATFQAAWLDEPLEVQNLPFAGQDAVTKVRKQRTELLATWGEVLSLGVFSLAIGSKREAEQVDPEAGAKAWEEGLETFGLSQPVINELTFDQGGFLDGITHLIENRLAENLSINVDFDNMEATEQRIEERHEDLLDGRTMQDLRDEMMRLQMEKAVTDLYHRHLRDPPTITFNNEQLDWTKDNLMKVMTFDDWSRYRKRLREEDMASKTPVDEQVDEILDPETKDEKKSASKSN